jgi:DNA-binding SARP family transcriptional activator
VGTEVEFFLLGPLVVRRGPVVVPVPLGKQRSLLAALLLSARRLLSTDELAEALWGAEPPPSARASLQTYVMRLRKSLADADHSLIRTQPDGYLIEIGAGQLDVERFESLAAAARQDMQAGEWAGAAAQLRAALALWRGQPMSGIQSDLLTLREEPRLAEMRLQALEARLDADLHLGRHGDVIGELRQLTSVHPLRERLHALLMVALYRAGRQADALSAYQAACRVLDAELGVEPGRELRELHQQVLTGNPALAPPGVTSDQVAVTEGPAQRHHAHPEPRPVVPRQLPAAVGDFVGRVPELKALTSMLDQASRRVDTVLVSVIAGTAGVGKTFMAVHWAHQVAGQFPDGQLYVNLRGFDPSGHPMAPVEAIRNFLDALQVPPESIPRSLPAQAALYRSLMADRRMLVLLDNARDSDHVLPLLPGNPGCLVLVTSRSELPRLIAEGARTFRLGMFSDEEATELLARRIGSVRVAAEPDAVHALAQLCSRLPQALAITAARASTRPGFPLTALAGELRDASGRLDALASGEQAADIRAVLSWSYHCLPPSAARMFRLLGLHPGPDVTAAAAASLAAVPLGQARGLLRELTRYHLLAEPDPGRYAFHDLLRAYAAERAREEDGEQDCRATVHRLLDHYLHTAYAGTRLMQPHRDTLRLAPAQPGVIPEPLVDHKQALAWYQAEHRVLLGAVAFAFTAGFDACAWQLPWCLEMYLDWQGHWQDWAAIQWIALEAVTPMGHPPQTEVHRGEQAMVRRGVAAVCTRLADYDTARVHLAECLRSYTQMGDRDGMSRVHRDLGNLAEYQQRYDEALRHAAQALRLAQSINDKNGEAFALTTVGYYQMRLGDYSLALGSCHRALKLHHQVGSRFGEAHTWMTLGSTELALGRYAEAATCYGSAHSLFAEVGDRLFEATALSELGDVLDADGNPPAARAAWHEALAIAQGLHHSGAASLRATLAARIGASSA